MTRTLLTRTIAAAAVAAAVTLYAPAPVAAQMDTVIVTPSNPKADKMAERAQYLADHARWHAAGEAFLRAAMMRRADDPQASRNFEAAANLYFTSGDFDSAFNAMVQSAEHALQRGDVITAAHAYVTAGWVAAQQRDERTMTRMNERARRLASSPLVTAADREGILRRTGEGRTLAASATP